MLFKSKYPDIAVPNVTVPELIFQQRDGDRDDQVLFIEGSNPDSPGKYTWGELKNFVQKVNFYSSMVLFITGRWGKDCKWRRM